VGGSISLDISLTANITLPGTGTGNPGKSQKFTVPFSTPGKSSNFEKSKSIYQS
jgi:hypothetical protein